MYPKIKRWLTVSTSEPPALVLKSEFSPKNNLLSVDFPVNNSVGHLTINAFFYFLSQTDCEPLWSRKKFCVIFHHNNAKSHTKIMGFSWEVLHHYLFFWLLAYWLSPVSCIQQLFQRKNLYDLDDMKIAIQDIYSSKPKDFYRAIHLLPEAQAVTNNMHLCYIHFIFSALFHQNEKRVELLQLSNIYHKKRKRNEFLQNASLNSLQILFMKNLLTKFQNKNFFYISCEGRV